MKIIIMLFSCLLMSTMAEAVEFKEIVGLIGKVKDRSKLLDLLVSIKIVNKPLWKEAEPIIKNVDGDLGRTSISITVSKSKTLKSLVLIGAGSTKDGDPNISIDSITVASHDEVRTFKFVKGRGYVEE